MAATNAITCPTDGCAETLTGAKSSICNPSIERGEIQRLVLGRRNNPFTPVADPVISTSVNNPTAWETRIGDNDAANPTSLVVLHVLGDKARPEEETTPLSLGRTKVTKRTHTVSFTSDEFNDINHDLFRTIECGGIFDLWYETSGKLVFGSADGIHIGIQVSIKAGMVIPRERAGVITWQGELTWEALHTETFMASPIPDTPEPA